MHESTSPRRRSHLREVLSLVCSALWILPAVAQPNTSQPGDLFAAGQGVSETQGGFGGGLQNWDEFGAALAVYPDMNGDGVDELLVGAPGDDAAKLNAGAVWLLTMNADGTVSDETKITTGSNGFTGSLSAQDRFGSSVTTLGDLDGNGVADIAVGAIGDSDSAPKAGAVWVLFMQADGTVIGQAKINDVAGGFHFGLGSLERFGSAVEALGDLDGDGILDLAVGARNDKLFGLGGGSVWILFLRADGSVRDGQQLANIWSPIWGPGTVEHFGSSLAALGDLDGDGVTELAVGAMGDDQGGPDRGSVWVLGLNTDGSVLRRTGFGSGKGGFGGQLDNFDQFGAALARVPDSNGDGIPELVVGAPGDDDGGFGSGAVWLVFLGADGRPTAESKISATEGGFPGVLSPGDRLGRGLAGDLSLSDDGIAELVVGAPLTDDGGWNRGTLWSLFFVVAEEEPQLGSGVNPNILVPGPTPPKLGLVWDPVILPTPPDEVLLGEPLVDFLGISRTTTVDTLGALLGGGGELLISLAPGDLLLCLQGLPGENFAVPIPSDPSLVGFQIYAQGFRINTLTWEETYTNGLDVVLGF